MTWIIKWDGHEMSSDDFLIGDLESIEKATGTPWSVCNVFKDVKVAKAFLAVAMLRQGESEAEVVAALDAVTLRTLKSAFEWRADEEEEHEEPDPSAPNPSSTSPGSSTGAIDQAGSPATPAGSA